MHLGLQKAAAELVSPGGGTRMSDSNDRLLGEMLVKGQQITESQLKMAQETQKQVAGARLGTILVKLRYIDEEKLAAFLGKQLNLPVLQLKDLVCSPQVSALIDLEVMEKKMVLPIRRTEDALLVAADDPLDYNAFDEIRFLTGLRTETAVATRTDIQKAIDYYFHGRPCEELAGAEAKRGATDASAGVSGSKGTSATPTEVLQALVELLISKGVVTREELTGRLKGSKKDEAQAK
jgi:type IV pilus assembly protein PilB